MKDIAATTFSKPGGSVADLGFMEARASLISIAAYLDRAERYGESDDFRNRALREGLQLVATGKADATLTRHLLESFSDSSVVPVEETPDYPVAGVVTPSVEDSTL